MSFEIAFIFLMVWSHFIHIVPSRFGEMKTRKQNKTRKKNLITILDSYKKPIFFFMMMIIITNQFFLCVLLCECVKMWLNFVIIFCFGCVQLESETEREGGCSGGWFLPKIERVITKISYIIRDARRHIYIQMPNLTVENGSIRLYNIRKGNWLVLSRGKNFFFFNFPSKDNTQNTIFLYFMVICLFSFFSSSSYYFFFLE